MQLVNKSEYVQVDWTVGNTCNYDCTYCPSISKDGSSPWPSIEVSEQIVKTLIKTYQNKKLSFILLGGELTLWKQFITFVDMIRNTAQDCKIKLLTNGIMPSWYWTQHSDKFDTIQFSFHRSANIKNFIDSVNSSTANVNRVFVMIDSTDFENSINDYYTIAKYATNANSIEGRMLDSRAWMLDGLTDEYKYTSEQIEKIKSLVKFNKPAKSEIELYEINNGIETKVKNSMKYIQNDTNHWQGWKCYIGLEKITLRENGDITRGSSCNVGGVIGNWRKNTLNLNNFSPVTCTMPKCMCGADIVISRHQ